MLAEDSADSSAKGALPTQWNKYGLATLVGASAYPMLKEGWDPLPMGKLPIGIE
jgi:hypothetical protein